MSYIVKMEDLLSVKDTIVTQMNSWITEFGHLQKELKTLSNTTAIEGATGDSIRSYVKEVQLPYIQSLIQFYELFRAAMLSYTTKYTQLEPDPNAIIKQNVLEQVREQTKQEKAVIFSGIEEDMHSVMRRIAPYGLPVSEPDGQNIKDVLNKMFTDAGDLDFQISNIEEGMKTEYLNDLKNMADHLNSYLTEILNNEEITMNTYRVGTIKGLTAYTDIQRDYEHYKDKMKKINQAADQQELDISCYELANEGKVKAVLQEGCAKVITESEMKAYLKKVCENNKDGSDSILNPVQESIDSQIAQGKKRSPVLTGILVGAGTALKAMTVDIVTGLCGHIQKLYNDPGKTLKEDGKTLALLGKLTSIPKTPEDMKIQEQVYVKIWEDIRGGFVKEVLNGSSYTRAEYISDVTVSVLTCFIGVSDIAKVGEGVSLAGKTAKTVSEVGDAAKAAEDIERGMKAAGEAGDAAKGLQKGMKEAGAFEDLLKQAKANKKLPEELWEDALSAETGKIDPNIKGKKAKADWDELVKQKGKEAGSIKKDPVSPISVIDKGASSVEQIKAATGIVEQLQTNFQHLFNLVSETIDKGKEILFRMMDGTEVLIEKARLKAQGISEAAMEFCITGCFAGEVLVLTEDGQRRIDRLKVGEKVYATDTETGEKGFQKILQIQKRNTNAFVIIKAGQEEIKTTPSHLFYLEKGTYQTAEALEAGDVLVTADGSRKVVDSVDILTTEEMQPIYNLTIECYHTYYVSKSAVLVHNLGCGNLAASMANVAQKTGLSTDEISQLCQKLENVQGKSKAEIREILNKLENGTATIAKTEADGKISYQVKDVNGEILAAEGADDVGRVINGKGNSYPKIEVDGYGEVPFPEGPYEPNNSSTLRQKFTDSYKKQFQEWWIAQGKKWPEGEVNIHHIKPLSKGGDNSFENLVPLVQPEEHQPFTNWWRSYPQKK